VKTRGVGRAATAGRRPRRARRETLRIGILGGTFDPPHYGHLAIAECAREELALDRVLFVPAGIPPHKRGAARSPAKDRVAMTRLAVRGNPTFAVSTIETRRPGPSYTSDTLRALAAAEPRAQWHLILGADMFATFESWHEPDVIAGMAVLVVAGRPGSRSAARGRRDRRVLSLENPLLPASSSGLRDLAARGHSLRYLVPDAVARYIDRHALYGRPGNVTMSQAKSHR